jgi:hypothetical protein
MALRPWLTVRDRFEMPLFPVSLFLALLEEHVPRSSAIARPTLFAATMERAPAQFASGGASSAKNSVREPPALGVGWARPAFGEFLNHLLEPTLIPVPSIGD